MEDQVMESETPLEQYQSFGDQFAYAAITATIVCTFSIINYIGYIV